MYFSLLLFSFFKYARLLFFKYARCKRKNICGENLFYRKNNFLKKSVIYEIVVF